MRASKKDEYFSVFDQLFCNRFYGGIGIREVFPSFDVADICNPDILVPEIKGVKFFPDLVDACES